MRPSLADMKVNAPIGTVSQPTYYFKNSNTPLKFNIDTRNDALEKVTPLQYGHCWFLCKISGVYWFSKEQYRGHSRELGTIEFSL